MTRIRLACVLSGIAAAGAGAVAQQTPPPQTFRAATDVVMIDVSVRSGGNPVQGLIPTDFVLTDNGVRQSVDTVEATAVPVDVTAIVDVSGSHLRTWDPPIDPVKIRKQLDDTVRSTASILRPDDRLRLVTIDTYIKQIFSLRKPAEIEPVGDVRSGGLASVYDSLVASLLQPVDPARRHIIVASTKGIDTISVTDANAVRDIARRSDALLHLVMMETASDNEAVRGRFQCGNMGLCEPTRLFWVPTVRASFTGLNPSRRLTQFGRMLVDAAESTGGGFHQAAGFTEPTLLGTFKKAFDDFRQSYVLRYTPKGVPRVGWHDVKVTVPAKSYVVHARRGYAIDPPNPPAAPPPPPSTFGAAPRPPPPLAARGAPAATLAPIIDAYGRGDYSAAMTLIGQSRDPVRLLRDFLIGGNPWPDVPKREAALAIDLAETALFASDETARNSGRALLSRFSGLVRDPLQPDNFERNWLWAAISVYHGVIQPPNSAPFVDAALERFPDDARFVLARAIVEDQKWPLGMATGTGALATGTPIPSHVIAVIARYQAAEKFTATVSEARVRLGWFLHRLGRDEEALVRLTDAVDARSTDTAMRYLAELFKGHVLMSLQRDAEAIEAFRAALLVWPGAQAARIALTNALLHHGDRDEAILTAGAVQTAPADTSDPWWAYWQGDLRFYPIAMARVRSLIR